MNEPQIPRVKFKTLGCRLNQYETQAMREQFLRAGYLETDCDGEADFLVLNTCTVTSESDREGRYLIRKFHRDHPTAKIVVTGCYVERNENEIKEIPGVTMTVLNRQKSEIVNLLESCTTFTFAPELPSKRAYVPLKISKFEGRSRAYVKIQDGCNHACSFCKVVLVRGPSRSREMEDVVEEAKRLADQGFKEVVLTGIQLGAYGYDFSKHQMLCSLIERLSEISNLERIRLSSIEATDVSDTLIDLMASNEKFCPHLHIPLQSGDDQVLRRMNRRYNRSFYLDLIQNIRQQVPDFVLTTDVMFGFPAETAGEFQNTVDLLTTAQPYKMHLFPYSTREGTKAARFHELVDNSEMTRRRDVLALLEEKLRQQVQKHFLGRRLFVLVEDLSTETGWVAGRCANYLKVKFLGDITPGTLLEVQVDKIDGSDLAGQTTKLRSSAYAEC